MSKPTGVLRHAKIQKGKRVLKNREPKQVETIKNTLVLHGNKTSQVLKDCLIDLNKILAGHCTKYTKRNLDIHPFEVGGETKLEHFARKSDCGLVVYANHAKKRPHNLTLGRFYDGQVLDLLELGVDAFRSIQEFAASGASKVQSSNKPCLLFAGSAFESSPAHKLAKSILLDTLRGQVVESLDLKGLDHVIIVAATQKGLLFRQYAIRLKKSGTPVLLSRTNSIERTPVPRQVPRVELEEMGPSMDLAMRRHREASSDLTREATKSLQPTKKKVKNVSTTMLEGRVGRMYLPQQGVDRIALHKMKGAKRQRREAAAERKAASA